MLGRMKMKTPVKPKKAALKPADWTPDQPLPSRRHEAAVLLAARGDRSLAQCYAAVYGGKSTDASVRTMSGRLFAKADVSARLEWIKNQVSEAVVEELGLTRIGLCKTLLEMLHASPLDIAMIVARAVGEDAKELKPDDLPKIKLASGVEPGLYGWKVKLSDKVAVAREIASIMGWHAEAQSAAKAAAANEEAAKAAASQANALGELVALARRQGSFGDPRR